MKINISRSLPFLIKIYFIVGSIIIVTSLLFYNNNLIMRMQRQAENTTRLFSRFTGLALASVENSNNQKFIRDIREAIDLPFVITDNEGRPMIWNEIGVPQVKDDEYDRLLDFDPRKPDDPLLERVLEKIDEFDRINKPVVVDTEEMKLFIHYGLSGLARELRIAPYVQLGVFVLFALFGFIGFRALKLGEQRSVWVGMAKETAHQLGTPLSSLMGWLEIMRGQIGSGRDSEKLSLAVDEAGLDVERLSRISSRFSKIGSTPELEYQDMPSLVMETVSYFERRRPALKIKSIIDVEFEELPMVRCSRDLVGWVFENLIKNSLDAISGKEGKISIKGSLNRKSNNIEILFSDTGRGMTAALKKRIFDPGITTKERGWGLGLALVKRIVEEIHDGSIRLVQSRSNEGTTFLVTFPVD
ncbi:MAG TPA: HAMP domain-containing sensor histidine kinase [Candidatus Krumholzibacteriaceae bacterium]|nr:HAMP domain-containing sensor histidine kinase [Candidatus Krumholzibacteriaceae bacterium]